MEHGNWTLIESDPGVFTELIRSFGVKGLEVEEVWDLDSYLAINESDVYGLIFLFKHDPSITSAGEPLPWDAVPDVFFARQVINNACATQAILSVLFNIPDDSAVALGDELAQFKAFTQSFDPELKGISITNSDTMRLAHNSFARAEPFANEIAPLHDEDKEDNFHFVAYVPTPVGVLELDGLKEGPVHVAEGTDGPSKQRTWVQNLVPVIQERIAAFAGSEIRFALMAVTRSKEDQLQSQVPDRAEREKSQVLSQLQIEREKMDRYRRENERRRHNYLPLILELLKQLAEKDLLEPALEKSMKEARKSLRRPCLPRPRVSCNDAQSI
ncbi:ubiquitin carboxyl-terminal hydrolase [Catenaria anguillulae PL171]|uniref:Ubiquitin carboxyl-terminal hydrolase n=1 Tax=Catenaria anguillulae PL171 TaxID=765915 RepID=A0A1Y2HTH2_9FUNG|nr:ubiquitin carboxyl-terminal hydrolase [Catenaria anguillulae PL171]